jgi:hypothetical protein
MAGQRKYQDGDRVEVWRKNRGQWVEGEVLDSKEIDGVWHYLVQLSGYTAVDAAKPDDWVPADAIRPAR